MEPIYLICIKELVHAWRVYMEESLESTKEARASMAS